MKNYLLFFILFIIFFSCNREEEFPGFTKTETGLVYKIKTIGEGTKKVKQGDYLLLHVTYRTIADSLLSDSIGIIKVVEPSFGGSFEEALTMMNEADCFVFIQPADSLFGKFLKVNNPYRLRNIKMELKLDKIITEKDIISERKKIAEDADIEEQRKLKQYLSENKIIAKPVCGGLYRIPLKSTQGSKVEQGKYVIINYAGYFLDGRRFDSDKKKTYLEFTIGDQYQVIKGLECAISLMHEGEKAKFIIPSQLAYGEHGSSTGIVPPYTTVIFEVELLTVK